MADGAAPAGGGGGAAAAQAAQPARQGGAGGGRRDGRAPVSAFVAGQEVLAWHRVKGWTNATVAQVREDGKYLLNWQDGEETDRVKTRTNLRKGYKDQMKTAKALTPRLSAVATLRDEGAGLAAQPAAGEGGAEGGLAADGAAKVGEGEVVISGGEVFAGGAEPGSAAGGAGSADPHGTGLKDQDLLAGKRDKRKSLDPECEPGESQAEILAGSKGAVPPPLSAGGWQKSEHTGLMSTWFQHKRWYHCELCDYLNDRLYHSKMHYERIHVKKGKQQFHKRKHTNALDSPAGGKDGFSSEDEGDDPDDESRKARLKEKKAREAAAAAAGDGSKSPGKLAKAGTKGLKAGVSSAQAGLDVLATLVTAEANAKGDGSGAMSMKAWLEMQVSLAAAKSKLAAEEAAKGDAGRDPKRAKTRGSSSADEAAKAALNKIGGAGKMGAAGKTKGAEEELALPGVDPATLEAYQNALSAAAVEEYTKAYQKILSATSSMDWSKVQPGVVNPLLLASLAANAPPVPEAGAGDDKGGGDPKKAGADKGKTEAGVEGVVPAPGVSLEGGVAVLLDAMRRHNEEGGKGGAKKGAHIRAVICARLSSRVQTGRSRACACLTPISDLASCAHAHRRALILARALALSLTGFPSRVQTLGGGKTADDDLAALGNLDMATATALSALIPSWLLGASGLGADGALAGK